MKTLYLFLLLLLMSCGNLEKARLEARQDKNVSQQPIKSPFSGKLPDYWYQGKAELSVYDLEQPRYGQMRKGVVTLIQVSEDFLTDKQVKNDSYSNPNSTPILKTNFIKRFTTGIYDYSIMRSVFTPTKIVEHPHTLKVTMSSQDWCGQTFGQLNYQGANSLQNQDKSAYSLEWRSYFEQEADQDEIIQTDWIEDELFNRLRIDPSGIPTGEQMILPSIEYLALVHKPLHAVKAICKRSAYTGDDFSGKQLEQFQIDYPSLDRVLTIVYETEAPYEILGWTDSYPSRGSQMMAKASLRKRVLAPYWGQNGNEFAEARAALGL